MRSFSLILMCLLGLGLYALPSYSAPTLIGGTMPTGISSSSNLATLMSTNITNTYDLTKRDPCGYDPQPILYHEYGTDSCPPPFRLKPNGQCQDNTVGNLDCASFCNLRTNFFYTYEQPFLSNSYCLGKMTCTISESEHQSWSWKVKTNLNINIPFIKGGIAGGYSGVTGGTGLSRSSKIDLDLNECGYFTFLPIVKESCGTFTKGVRLHKWDTDCDQSSLVTTSNECVTDPVVFTPKISVNGPAIRGDTCFVRTNCSNHERLPMDQQNDAYRHDGVTMPQEMYAGYAAYYSYLATVPISSLESLTMACDQDDGAWSISPGLQPTASLQDCQDNLQNLLLTPQKLEGPGGPHKGDKTWLVSSSTCVVVLEFDMNWAPSCVVSWAEVAATVQMILGTCTVRQGGLVGGRRQLRNDGKCDSTVFVGGHT